MQYIIKSIAITSTWVELGSIVVDDVRGRRWLQTRDASDYILICDRIWLSLANLITAGDLRA